MLSKGRCHPMLSSREGGLVSGSVLIFLPPLSPVTMMMRLLALPLLQGALAPKFPLHGYRPRTGRPRVLLEPHLSLRERARKMTGTGWGPVARERGGSLAPLPDAA